MFIYVCRHTGYRQMVIIAMSEPMSKEIALDYYSRGFNAYQLTFDWDTNRYQEVPVPIN
jgi:hypothetical protein